eukprot:4599394-Alexandrium_andersonii.AAC.1
MPDTRTAKTDNAGRTACHTCRMRPDSGPRLNAQSAGHLLGSTVSFAPKARAAVTGDVAGLAKVNITSGFSSLRSNCGGSAGSGRS